MSRTIDVARPLLSFPYSLRVSFRLLSLAAVLAVLGMLATPAHAAKDEVHFGESIDVAKGETIHDAVCFFCSVHVDGEVTGDVVSFFGDVQVAGQVNHDVVNFFGEVRLEDEASVGHDTVEMFGRLRQAESASVGGHRVVMLGWVFWMPFLLVCLSVAFLRQEMRMARRRRILGGY